MNKIYYLLFIYLFLFFNLDFFFLKLFNKKINLIIFFLNLFNKYKYNNNYILNYR